VKANGNSNKVSNYELVDIKAPFSQASTLYYRLRLVDADGSYEYSEIVSVTEQPVKQEPVVYPNPFNGDVFATIALDKETRVKVITMDITGKVIQTQEMELAKGVQTLQLSTQDLHPGMYFLTFDLGGKIFTQKVIKQ
jgi:hypothetical protein